MLKKLKTPVLLMMCILSVPLFLYLFNCTQAVQAAQANPVQYELPYPGILPGNPLYGVKTARDAVLQWMTRDNLKKAQLRLQISDKDVRGSQMLMTGHDYTHAHAMLIDAERVYARAIEDTMRAGQQGASPTSEFKDHLKMSNMKHHEVIQDILKSLPAQYKDDFAEAARINESNRRLLNKSL